MASKKRSFSLPPEYEPRIPKGNSPLAEFIESCRDDLKKKRVTLEDVVREYQAEWCDHPRPAQFLSTTFSAPDQMRFEYTIICDECGRVKTYKGHPPSYLNRMRFAA